MMKVAPDECFIARMTCKCKSQSENEDDTAANITVSLKSAIWNVVKPSEQQVFILHIKCKKYPKPHFDQKLC